MSTLTTASRISAPPVRLQDNTAGADNSGDAYYSEAYVDIARMLGDNGEKIWQTHAALILKPDAIVARKIGSALEFVRDHGFVPVAFSQFLFTRNIVRELWRTHPFLGQPKIAALVDMFIASAPSFFIVLRNEGSSSDAVEALRRTKGPSLVEQREPHHLRAQLDSRYPLLNFVHSADDIYCSVREFAIFLSHWERLRILRAVMLGADCTGEILSSAEELDVRYLSHDLCFENAVQRIRCACEREAEIDAPGRETLLFCCAALLEGRSRDWNHLLELLDEKGVATDLWDRVTVGIHLLSV